MDNQDYIPGICNINQAEIAYRRKAGYVSLVIFAVVAAGVLLFDTPRWLHLILFFPAFLVAISFLQAQQRFCVSYGASGKQNASEGSSEAHAVDEASAAVDKKRARTMNLQAAGIAMAVALLALLIP